jgi:hypothetical protein
MSGHGQWTHIMKFFYSSFFSTPNGKLPIRTFQHSYHICTSFKWALIYLCVECIFKIDHELTQEGPFAWWFFLLSYFFGYMQWHKVFDNAKFHIKFFMGDVNIFYMFALLHVFYYLDFVMMQMKVHKLKQNVWENNHLKCLLGLFIIDQFFLFE